MRPRPRLALALLAGAVLAAGAGACRSGADDAGSRSTAAPAAPGVADANVIRRWAGSLRRGDLDGAAGFFALPVVVSNGTPPLRLVTRAQVRAFNAALPCGARLVRTVREAGYVIATFELTERPGGRCGEGTGGRAYTAFRLQDGRFAEWLRLPSERLPEDQPPGTPQEPAPSPDRDSGPIV